MTEKTKAEVLDLLAWMRAHLNRIAHDRGCTRDDVLLLRYRRGLVAMELMRQLGKTHV